MDEHVSVRLAAYISIGTEAKQPRAVNVQIVLWTLKDF